ncbi:MAG: hypothetical protein QM770_12840 [Tepidisphaeraceae bacterium]
MRLETAKLLEDIRTAARDALDMATGKTYDDYLGNKQLRYAIERCFEIAGEALTQLSKFDPDTAILSPIGEPSSASETSSSMATPSFDTTRRGTS